MKNIFRNIALAGFISLFIFNICGCAGLKPGNYGSLAPDGAVENAFTTGTLKPNLTYYYLASEDTPFVIIGVDKNLVLDDAKDWNLMVPQLSEHLRRVVKLSYDRWRAEGYTFRGFRILDQDGRYIGDWYSIWDMNTVNPVIYSKDQGHVVIYPPTSPRLEPSPAGSSGFDHK